MIDTMTSSHPLSSGPGSCPFILLTGIVVLFLCPFASALAEETKPAVEMEQWIEALGSPSRSVRHAAQEKLLECGSESLPFLQESLRKTDEARAFLLEAIVRQLAERQAEMLVHSSEAFQVEATEVRPRDPGRPSRTLRVRLSLKADPAITPEYVMVRDADFVIKTGPEELPPFSPDAVREVNFTGNRVEFSMDFLRTPKVPAAPLELHGELRIRCGVLREPLSFSLHNDIGRTRSAGQTAVKLVEATVISPSEPGERQRIALRLRVFYPPGLRWESHRQGHLHRNVFLQPPTGEELKPVKLALLKGSTAVHDVQYEFEGTPDLMKNGTLVYSTSVLQTTAVVPVQIKLESEED